MSIKRAGNMEFCLSVLDANRKNGGLTLREMQQAFVSAKRKTGTANAEYSYAKSKGWQFDGMITPLGRRELKRRRQKRRNGMP